MCLCRAYTAKGLFEDVKISQPYQILVNCKLQYVELLGRLENEISCFVQYYWETVMLQFSSSLDFIHCQINFAGVWNVEVRPTISTDPNPDRKLSLLVNGKNPKTAKPIF